MLRQLQPPPDCSLLRMMTCPAASSSFLQRIDVICRSGCVISRTEKACGPTGTRTRTGAMTKSGDLRVPSLLTSWSRVHLERLIGSQLVKKFPTFYGTRKFITASKVPATCPYPEPSRSSPCPHIPFPEDLF